MVADGTRKGLILFLTSMAQFMVVLDIAIVNVALPSIQQDLGMRQSALQWIVIAYGLFLGGFLLLGGRLGDLLGRKRVFLGGLVIFTVASLLAGLANSSELLIGSRALQGFGAALVAPTALSILAVTFSEGSERNKALGIFGAVGGTSASIGVIASGLLTDGPGWRWIFFINLPVGIVLLGLASRFLATDRVQAEAKQYDALGAATITGSLLVFIYGLNRGVDHGWSAGPTVALFITAAALFAAFIWTESNASSPLVPFSALKNRVMATADVASFLLFGAYFSFFFLGTLLMQQQLGYSPTKTGLAWLATSVPAFILAAVNGAVLVTKIGIRPLLMVGPLFMVASAGLLTRVDSTASFFPDLLVPFVLAGISIGLSAPTVQIGALSGVASKHVGLASGLVETSREIGGAVAIAAVSTVLVSGLADSEAGIGIPDMDGFQSAFFVILGASLLGGLISTFGFPGSLKPEPDRLGDLEELTPEPI